MLAAKSISTGCPSTTGNAVLLNSHATLEHDGLRSRSHIGEKHRGANAVLPSLRFGDRFFATSSREFQYHTSR
jgi:hypothetical protein